VFSLGSFFGSTLGAGIASKCRRQNSQEFLDEPAVAISPVPQFHEFNPHLDVQLNVKCSSVLELDVDFVSIGVIGKDNALYDLASNVFDKSVGHFSSSVLLGFEKKGNLLWQIGPATRWQVTGSPVFGRIAASSRR
jgi:hypothetical protein